MQKQKRQETNIQAHNTHTMKSDKSVNKQLTEEKEEDERDGIG